MASSHTLVERPPTFENGPSSGEIKKIDPNLFEASILLQNPEILALVDCDPSVRSLITFFPEIRSHFLQLYLSFALPLFFYE